MRGASAEQMPEIVAADAHRRSGKIAVHRALSMSFPPLLGLLARVPREMDEVLAAVVERRDAIADRLFSVRHEALHDRQQAPELSRCGEGSAPTYSSTVLTRVAYARPQAPRSLRPGQPGRFRRRERTSDTLAAPRVESVDRSPAIEPASSHFDALRRTRRWRL